MKKNIIYALAAFILCVFAVQDVKAQRFIGSVAAGVNFAQIEGDGVHGFTKVGFNGGAGLTVPLNPKQTWQLHVELLYAQKGSYKKCQPGYFDTNYYAPSMYTDVDRSVPWDSTIKCKMALDYVQIPLLVRYEEMYSGCTFALGFSWSRLVRAKEIYNGFTRTTTARSKTFKTSDWSFLADINIRLYKNLSLNFRYEYSLAPIRTMDFTYVRTDGSTYTETYKLHNHVITTRLVYYINEKFYKNTRVNKNGQRMGTPWLREIPESND
ncbi:MAG: PorT family protein [Bacteroidales bacterium]|nr:PorT family protein [Bacteroidales bacterium]